MNAKKLISDYRLAYAAANAKPLSEDLTYQNGWFVFRERFGVSRYRRKALEMMLGRLRDEAASKGFSTGDVA